MTSNANVAKFIVESFEQEYSDKISSLFDISRDTSNNRNFIEMDFQSIHFDQIPYEWTPDQHSKNSFSVDTLLYDETKNILYLIEFKSSWPKDRIGQELRFKAYESLSKIMKYWQQKLDRNKKEFFELTINYCVITRAKATQNYQHKSFVDALTTTQNFFNLKNLDDTIFNKTRIFVDPQEIFQFLSRVTGVENMIYHHIDGTKEYY